MSHSPDDAPAHLLATEGDGDFLVKWKQGFQGRKDAYVKRMEKTSNKYTFLLNATRGRLDRKWLLVMLEKIRNRNVNCDMDMISVVRLLYLIKQGRVPEPAPAPAPAKDATGTAASSEVGLELKEMASLEQISENISSLLQAFPYWPSSKQNPAVNATTSNSTSPDDFKHLCFWSENHILMTLGSAHLVQQLSTTPAASAASAPPDVQAHGDLPAGAIDGETVNPVCGASGENVKAEAGPTPPAAAPLTHEEHLLLVYLQAHVSFGGMYEVMSHVYIPYTVSALLNLIDFSSNALIVEAARTVCNNVVKLLLLGTTDAGVANLTANARGNNDTRKHNHSHNVNRLVHMLTGTGNVGGNTGASHVSDFIWSTSWVPCMSVLRAQHLEGRLQLNCNHKATTQDINEVYADIAPGERAPFYWSAGLIAHPLFTRETKQYQRDHNLNNNDTLKILAWFPDMVATRVVSMYGYFSRGQSYCDITLNVYKKAGGLCLTSFESFSVGDVGFQQLPWCANIGGAAVWTQTGGGPADSFAGYGMTNTHNPNVVQRGPVCVVAHSAPTTFQAGILASSFLSYVAHLYWPHHLLSDQSIYTLREDATDMGGKMHWLQFSDCMQNSPVPCWRVGRRGKCFVGVYCTHATSFHQPGTKSQAKASDPYVCTIACKDNKHCWVVLVGTVDEYPATKEETDKDKDKDKEAAAKAEADASGGVALAAKDGKAEHEEAAWKRFIQRCLSLTVSWDKESKAWHVQDEVEDVICVTMK